MGLEVLLGARRSYLQQGFCQPCWKTVSVQACELAVGDRGYMLLLMAVCSLLLLAQSSMLVAQVHWVAMVWAWWKSLKCWRSLRWVPLTSPWEGGTVIFKVLPCGTVVQNHSSQGLCGGHCDAVRCSGKVIPQASGCTAQCVQLCCKMAFQALQLCATFPREKKSTADMLLRVWNHLQSGLAGEGSGGKEVVRQQRRGLQF